jgi:hypothetical protein
MRAKGINLFRRQIISSKLLNFIGPVVAIPDASIKSLINS